MSAMVVLARAPADQVLEVLLAFMTHKEIRENRHSVTRLKAHLRRPRANVSNCLPRSGRSFFLIPFWAFCVVVTGDPAAKIQGEQRKQGDLSGGKNISGGAYWSTILCWSLFQKPCIICLNSSHKLIFFSQKNKLQGSPAWTVSCTSVTSRGTPWVSLNLFLCIICWGTHLEINSIKSPQTPAKSRKGLFGLCSSNLTTASSSVGLQEAAGESCPSWSQCWG